MPLPTRPTIRQGLLCTQRRSIWLFVQGDAIVYVMASLGYISNSQSRGGREEKQRASG